MNFSKVFDLFRSSWFNMIQSDSCRVPNPNPGTVTRFSVSLCSLKFDLKGHIAVADPGFPVGGVWTS